MPKVNIYKELAKEAEEYNNFSKKKKVPKKMKKEKYYK